jgi:hypothetical protein
MIIVGAEANDTWQRLAALSSFANGGREYAMQSISYVMKRKFHAPKVSRNIRTFASLTSNSFLILFFEFLALDIDKEHLLAVCRHVRQILHDTA